MNIESRRSLRARLEVPPWDERASTDPRLRGGDGLEDKYFARRGVDFADAQKKLDLTYGSVVRRDDGAHRRGSSLSLGGPRSFRRCLRAAGLVLKLFALYARR